MAVATLSGATVLACDVHLPAWGIPWVDAELDSSEQLSGSVVFVLADLEMACTVMSGGPWQGRARYRIAGGTGGWGESLPARGYDNGAGVKLATVLGDAATECGETLDGATVSGSVGFSWVRSAGPAARQLHLLAPRNWYVGTDGVTRIGARAAAAYAGGATVVSRDVSGARVVLAADSVAPLVPGVIVDGVQAIDVQHTLADGVLRTTIHGTRYLGGTRLGSAFGSLVDALTAELRYRGLWSYRVVSQSGEVLDLQCERASSGLPDLQRVPVRLAPGLSVDHAPGSMVLVAFVDGDPSRPVVVAGDDPDSPGWTPSRMDLVGTDDTIPGATVGSGRALRYGDGHVCAFTGAAVPLVADPAAPAVSVSRVRP